MSRGLRISLVTVALGVGVLGLWNPPGKAHSEASSPVVILFTNDLGGFLESCQCSGPSVVGLPRLVGTLKKLRQEYPEALVLDSGNLGADLPTAEVAAQALAMVPYDAIGVGGADWKLGPAFWRVADQASLPLLVSNRTYAEAAPQSVRPVRVVQRQGLKIALLGFSPSPPDKERPGLDQPEALVRSSAEAPPEQSPQDCLAMVPEDADVVIIMSQLGFTRDLQLAKELVPHHPRQRILLFGGAAWETLLAPMSLGSTVIFPTGGQAQSVTIVELASASDQVDFKCRKYRITGRDPVDSKAAEIVHRHYVKLAEETRSKESARRSLSYDYVPAGECAVCHQEAFQQWETSAHARAVETLRKAERLVPECLSCHSEAFRRSQRVERPGTRVGGVECSACHGDGILRSVLRTTAEMVARPPEDTCRRCHTPEKSPDFDFQTASRKIAH